MSKKFGVPLCIRCALSIKKYGNFNSGMLKYSAVKRNKKNKKLGYDDDVDDDDDDYGGDKNNDNIQQQDSNIQCRQSDLLCVG
jgi:hypothetical protein